jgi:hypothetical protein
MNSTASQLLHSEDAVTGCLKADAQVRGKLSADGQHTTPAVCFTLVNLQGLEAETVVMHVSCSSYTNADKLATELRQGRCIRFIPPLKTAQIIFSEAPTFQIL